MKQIKVGIFGLGRGASFIGNILACNGEIVALCDKNEQLRAKYSERYPDAGVYDNFDDFILGGTYVSFPIADLIKEDQAEFRLDWKWYESIGMGISKDIEDYTYLYNWTRNSFEQAPLRLDTKAAKAIN